MTVDDSIVVGSIVALAGAVVWLWKAMDRRYQTELAKRDAEFKELKADHKALIQRVRTLEDERIPTQAAHATKIEALTDRADRTENNVVAAMRDMAKAVREIAANVNTQTEAIRGMKCRTFSQDAIDLPDPHPAAKGTDAIVAKNQGH